VPNPLGVPSPTMRELGSVPSLALSELKFIITRYVSIV